MASSDGIITEKDIIEKKALEIGITYAKNMEVAEAANQRVVLGLKEANVLAEKFGKASNQSEFISLKNQQSLVIQKLIGDIKAKEAAEISMLKIEREAAKNNKALTDSESKLGDAKKKTTKLTAEERVQLEFNNRMLKEAAINNLNLGTAYQKLNRERTIAKKALLDLLAAEKQDTAAIKEATKAFTELDKRVRAADHAVGDFTKNVGNYPKLTAFTSGLKNLIGAFGLVGGVQAFAAIIGDAYKTIKEFEQSLADLSSITGATGKDLAFLKNSAIDLGQKVEGGAKAVVEAYKLIAGAKPELLDNVKALNQVTEAAITLSQAAGMTLPDSATALTDAMNQFGAGAEEAQVFIDALANGAKYGSAEIPQLTEALLKFGAVARSSNITIQESAALVELLAENGLKGAEAGTALRNILLKISAPDALPKLARAEFEKLGISMETLRDKTIPVAEKLALLKPLLKDNASIVKVFGVENATAAINVLSHNDRLKELTGQMGEFGTAEEQATIRMNTLTGKTEKLKSTYDSFILSIGQGSGAISEFFKFFIDGADGALKGLIRMNSSWDQLVEKAKNTGAAEGVKEFAKEFAKLKNIGGSDKTVAIELMKWGVEDYNKAKKELDDLIALSTELGVKAGLTGEDLERFVKKTYDPVANERIRKELAKQLAFIVEARKKYKGETSKATAPTTPGETPESGESDKELKARLKREKELNDALYELEKQRLERIIKINGEISEDQTLKDDVRIKAVEKVNSKEIELANLTKQHKLDADKFALDEDKLNANQKLFIAREAENKIVDVNKKAQKDIEKIREFDEQSYQDSLDKRVSRINVFANQELEAENTRHKALLDLETVNSDESDASEAARLKNREQLIKQHEERVFNIRKDAALAILRAQVDTLEGELKASDALPENERLSAKKRQEIAEKLSKAKLDISEKELEEYQKDDEKRLEQEIALSEKILEVSTDLTNALADLTNALSERKIQKIDEEIDKNNEYYDKQIKLAGDDDKQKALLEAERDKKNEILEKKKRKEQEKQAKFNKAVTIAQITIQTALAVMKGFADSGWVGAILAGALGAISLATAIATPIPKYKMGRIGGKKEKAIINDGGVSEVVESKDGTAKIYEGKNRLVQLLEGDTVHRSVEDYTNSQRKKLLNGVDAEGKKMNEFQKIIVVNDKRDPELISEIRLLRKSVERNKPLKSQQKNVDLSHQLWKIKNMI